MANNKWDIIEVPLGLLLIVLFTPLAMLAYALEDIRNKGTRRCP